MKREFQICDQNEVYESYKHINNNDFLCLGINCLSAGGLFLISRGRALKRYFESLLAFSQGPLARARQNKWYCQECIFASAVCLIVNLGSSPVKCGFSSLSLFLCLGLSRVRARKDRAEGWFAVKYAFWKGY